MATFLQDNFAWFIIIPLLIAGGWATFHWRKQIAMMAISAWFKLAPHCSRLSTYLWPKHDDDTAAHIAVKPWKYWLTMTILSVATFVVLLSDFLFPHLLSGVQIGPLYLPYSWLWTLLLGAYLFDAWYTVHAKQYGGIFVFHQPAATVGPGPKLAPRFVTEIHLVPRDIQTSQFPGPPNKITHVHDDQPLEQGMVRPIRILTGPRDPSRDRNDPLNSQRTLEIQWYARWHVERIYFFDFWDRLPGKTWEEKLALLFEQMRTVGTSTIAGDLNRLAPFEITARLESVNKKLKRKLQECFNGSGIIIDEAGLQAPDLGLTLSRSLEDLAASKADAAKTVIRAGAKRTELAEEGRGLAEAKEAMLAAGGEGLAKAAKALGVTPAEYLAAHIAETTIGKGTIVIGTDGVREAIGIGKAILKPAEPVQPTT